MRCWKSGFRRVMRPATLAACCCSNGGRSQSSFVCVACGHEANADVNAAVGGDVAVGHDVECDAAGRHRRAAASGNSHVETGTHGFPCLRREQRSSSAAATIFPSTTNAAAGS
jgi:hypothetical protein